MGGVREFVLDLFHEFMGIGRRRRVGKGRDEPAPLDGLLYAVDAGGNRVARLIHWV